MGFDNAEGIMESPQLMHFTLALGSTESGLKNDHNLTLKEWLNSLKLAQYLSAFQDNLYSDMDRIKNIWDDELLSILDIDKIGHRKRILLSLAGREGLLNRFGKVQVRLIQNVRKLCFSYSAWQKTSYEYQYGISSEVVTV